MSSAEEDLKKLLIAIEPLQRARERQMQRTRRLQLLAKHRREGVVSEREAHVEIREINSTVIDFGEPIEALLTVYEEVQPRW